MWQWSHSLSANDNDSSQPITAIKKDVDEQPHVFISEEKMHCCPLLCYDYLSLTWCSSSTSSRFSFLCRSLAHLVPLNIIFIYGRCNAPNPVLHFSSFNKYVHMRPWKICETQQKSPVFFLEYTYQTFVSLHCGSFFRSKSSFTPDSPGSFPLRSSSLRWLGFNLKAEARLA